MTRLRAALLLVVTALAGCELCDHLIDQPGYAHCQATFCEAVCGDGTCAVRTADGELTCSP